MVNTPLDMKYIYKRERFLERKKSLTESARIPDLSDKNYPKDYCRLKIENFLRECSSYKDAVCVLESLYKDDNFEMLEMATQKVINEVIPMIETTELPNCISYIESSEIGNVNKDRIIEAAKIYKNVDRIRKNHKNISKRFDLSNINTSSNRDKCFKVCEMVDTYSLSRFIKFNIALEEIAYLGFMNGNRMPDKVMVENVSDYFLMIEDNTQEDIASYKRAIESSKVISEGADQFVGYLMHDAANPSNYWKDRINEWKINPEKNIDTLVELARENYSDITVLNSIIDTINEFCKINNIEFDTMKIFTENNNYVDGAAAHNIISFIEENDINNANDLLESLNMIWEAETNDTVYDDGTKTPETFTSDEIDKFKMHNLIVDAQAVGEFLDQLEKTSMKESPNGIKKISTKADDTDLNESNLIDHVDANGYISMKLRSYSYGGSVNTVADLLESSINCINNILYNKDSYAYYNLFDESFDICMRSKYKIMLSEAQEMKRGFTESEKEAILNIRKYVNTLEKISESRLPAIVDKLHNDRSIAATIGVKEATTLYDALSMFNEPNEYGNDGFLDEFVVMCREEANQKFDTIKRECASIKPVAFSYNSDSIFDRIDFAADMLGIEEGVVDTAVGNVKKAVGNLKNAGRALVGKGPAENQNQVPQPAPIAANNKVSIPAKDKIKTTNKNANTQAEDDTSDAGDEKKAISSMNDVKLAWQGVKAKFKGASAKEQEMSRDLDMEFNHVLKSIQSAYGSDHREEIITGEVNHSLSKAIKIGIGLAGAGAGIGAATGGGALAGAAIAPIVGAICTFAKSKFTTKKEKQLILDEIDIELRVLEREINRAEQSGSTKKYRQLLTIEKNLQRRRQEIYYGMAKKGQRIPMQSTAGMRPRE